MIINQFRKYSAINMLYLSVIGLLFCVGVLIQPPADIDAFLAEEWLMHLLGVPEGLRISHTLNVLLTLVLTVIQALYLNRVLNKYNFTKRPSFLTALMYVTLASLMPPFLLLSPSLICNFMVIWMLDKMVGIHYRDNALPALFDLGMIVALGSLIYFPFILNLLVIWVALLVFRAFYWREWIAPLIGILAVYFLVWTVSFWRDETDHFMAMWQAPFSLNLLHKMPADIREYLIALPVIIILILAMNSLRQHVFKRIILIRKIVLLLMFLLFVTVLGLLLDAGKSRTNLLLLAPTVSVYAAFYFQQSKVRWVYESLYLVLVLSICLFHIL